MFVGQAEKEKVRSCEVREFRWVVVVVGFEFKDSPQCVGSSCAVVNELKYYVWLVKFVSINKEQ